MTDNAKPTAHGQEEPQAPTDWAISMDREWPVRDGVEACKRAGINLSGSRFEKATREARRLDFTVYRLGGGIQTDRKRLGQMQRTRQEQIQNKARLEKQGKEHQIDAAIASTERGIQILEKRIASAGVVEETQASRKEKVDLLQRQVNGLQSQMERIRLTPGVQIPDELDHEMDDVIPQLDAAERDFEAGAVELHKLNQAKVKAESETRRGLATTLRDRVLPKIAEFVQEEMRGKVAIYMRRTDKDLPSKVRVALREAETVCANADRLSGENVGIAPFAVWLDEDLGGFLFPTMDFEGIRRARAEEKPEGVAGMTL